MREFLDKLLRLIVQPPTDEQLINIGREREREYIKSIVPELRTCPIHDQRLVCLRCIQQMPPLQIVPETPKRPCLEYFGKVNERINTIIESDTETLPHLSMRQMEELLAKHKEAS